MAARWARLVKAAWIYWAIATRWTYDDDRQWQVTLAERKVRATMEG